MSTTTATSSISAATKAQANPKAVSSSANATEKSQTKGKAEKDAEYTRLINAMKAVKGLLATSELAKAAFAQNYKDMFADLYIKIFVHARDRGELDALQDELEPVWKQAFPEISLPKIPEKKKKLEILPGTSFEDAVSLIEKHQSDTGNMLVILKYLQSALGNKESEIKPKKIRTTKIVTTLNKYSETMNPPVLLKQLIESLVDACNRILTDAAAEEAVKKASEERVKDNLSKLEAPTAAQKRALEKLSGGKNTVFAPSSSSASSNAQKVPLAPGKTTGVIKPILGKASSSSTAIKSSANKPSTGVTNANKSEAGKKKAEKPRRRLTDAEYERMFLKRARESNILREYEEMVSESIGAQEDREADLG